MKIPVKYRNKVHEEYSKRGGAGAGPHQDGGKRKNKSERNKKERRKSRRRLKYDSELE
jgi:hypothetical protein